MLSVNQQTIHLGNIKNGIPVHFKFIVSNKEDNIININSLHLGCGSCTQASIDKSELKQGESATIQVTFTPGSTGINNKSVTVDYNNGSSKHSLRLQFTAQVYG